VPTWTDVRAWLDANSTPEYAFLRDVVGQTPVASS